MTTITSTRGLPIAVDLKLATEIRVSKGKLAFYIGEVRMGETRKPLSEIKQFCSPLVKLRNGNYLAQHFVWGYELSKEGIYAMTMTGSRLLLDTVADNLDALKLVVGL